MAEKKGKGEWSPTTGDLQKLEFSLMLKALQAVDNWLEDPAIRAKVMVGEIQGQVQNAILQATKFGEEQKRREKENEHQG